MPSLADHELDPDRETAYRRGYMHAMSHFMTGVVEKLNESDRKVIEDWHWQKLTPWSRGDVNVFVQPPAFPSL